MIRTRIINNIEFELEDADIVFECHFCKELVQSTLDEDYQECPACSCDVLIADCEIIEQSIT